MLEGLGIVETLRNLMKIRGHEANLLFLKMAPFLIKINTSVKSIYLGIGTYA